MLKELRLPAAIAKVVLAGAMQDFIDEARPSDDADWLTLARTARAFTRERIEDYIAAATAGGPLMPDVATLRTQQRHDEKAARRCASLALVPRRSPLTMVAAAQAPAAGPQLRILSPGETPTSAGRRCCGRASSRPRRVTGLTFFVDGRQVCALTQLPFECEWDAGPRDREHQVRAVATLKDGGRLVQTVRTKSVGYTERVDVDVVQVTVTVSDDARPLRPRHAAVGVSRPRRRPAAGDHALRLRGRAARAGRRHRHLRQHGAGDAEAENGGEGVPRRRAGAGPGDAARLQRQHLHA